MFTSIMRFGFAALTLGAWLGMGVAAPVQADDYCESCDSCAKRHPWSGLFSRCDMCGQRWCTCHKHSWHSCNGRADCGRRYHPRGLVPTGPHMLSMDGSAGTFAQPGDPELTGRRYYRWLPESPYTTTSGHLHGGQYPMIYWPTDTTQQGFYHQHVPRWRPLWAAY
jgi:hypothetical protein